MARGGIFRNYVFSLFTIVLCVYVSCISGEYLIVHSPPHTHFLPDGGKIDLSDIPKVVLSSFGFDLKQDIQWKGLTQGSPFKRPRAHTIVSVEGLEDGVLQLPYAAKYNINNDIAQVDTESVRDAMRMRPKGQESFVVDYSEYSRIYDIKSKYPALFKDLPSSFTGMKAIFTQGNVDIASFGSLNITNDADLAFLGEIFMLKGIIAKLNENRQIADDSRPDFLHVRVSGLSELISTYGRGSVQVIDALNLLQDTIKQLTSDLRALYHDNVVVQIVVYKNDHALPRKVRSLKADPTPTPSPAVAFQDQVKVAASYHENYGVMFNLILWLSVGLIVILVFISCGVWNMDPGRDSIIYRMTSQRMKRD